MELIIIILGLILVVCIYIIINLSIKYNTIVKFVESKTILEEDLYATYSLLITDINEAYNNMVRIDKKGMFEKDDAVGLSFEILLNIIKTLSEKINKLSTLIPEDGRK